MAVQKVPASQGERVSDAGIQSGFHVIIPFDNWRKCATVCNMNALLMAWETTVEDVENVLKSVGENIALAPEYFVQLDCEAIASAVVDSESYTIAMQTKVAYAEINRQIEEDL